MKVEIQSKKLVKPATPTPSHLENLNLSSIDQLMYPLFIPVIFYFDHNSNGSDHHQMMQTTEALTARLEEWLSKVLSLYYPFAGRYNEDEDSSTICCHDQGAEFVVASVDRRLDEIVYGEYHHLLISDVHASGFTSTTPLLSIQVNLFTCGGLAISVGLMHKLGDMFTFSMFLQAWATSCRLNGISDEVPLPNFSALSSFLPPKPTKPQSPSSLASTQLLHPPPNYIMRRFTFSGEAISMLKSQLNPSDYTRVEIVTALITQCLINIECSKPDIMATFLLAHPMNMRSRTTLPIQENSSGNFCTMVVATRQVENESRDLQELASFIRNSLRNAADEIGKVGNWGEIGRKVEGAILEFNQRQIDKEKVNPVIFTSWCKFGLNDIDFGLGKPSLVSTVKEPLNIIRLVDCKNDARGIEAWVCLKEDDMTHFREEPDILEYASF